MPGVVLDSDIDLSCSSNDATLVASPRQCTHMKCHMEGMIVMLGIFKGKHCTFEENNSYCDLCCAQKRNTHNKKVSSPIIVPIMSPMFAPPFGAALDF